MSSVRIGAISRTYRPHLVVIEPSINHDTGRGTSILFNLCPSFTFSHSRPHERTNLVNLDHNGSTFPASWTLTERACTTFL
jgi:hypothetical protein